MIRHRKLYEASYEDSPTGAPTDNAISISELMVVFPAEVYQKMFSYIKAIDEEISGLGSVEIDGNTIRVKDVFLLEQQVSGGSTRLDVDGLTKFYDNKMKGGDDLSSYKIWWHSHNTMATFWSGIDEATIEDFNTEKNDSHNWMLSIVGNHAMDLKIRLDIFKPFRVTVEDIKYEVNYLSDEAKEEIKREVASKVHTQKYFGGYLSPGKHKTKSSQLELSETIKIEGEDVMVDYKKKPKNLSGREWKKWKKRRQRAVAKGNYYMASDGHIILPGDEDWPAGWPVGAN